MATKAAYNENVLRQRLDKQTKDKAYRRKNYYVPNPNIPVRLREDLTPQQKEEIVLRFKADDAMHMNPEVRRLAARRLIPGEVDGKYFDKFIEQLNDHFDACESKKITDDDRIFKAPRCYKRMVSYYKTYYTYNLGRGLSLRVIDLGNTCELYLLWLEVECYMRNIRLRDALQMVYIGMLNETFDPNIIKYKGARINTELVDEIKRINDEMQAKTAKKLAANDELKKAMVALKQKSLKIRSGRDMRRLIDQTLQSLSHIIAIKKKPGEPEEMKQSVAAKRDPEKSVSQMSTPIHAGKGAVVVSNLTQAMKKKA